MLMTRLLVVDDENNIRKMIRKFAEFEGYEVYEAWMPFRSVRT